MTDETDEEQRIVQAAIGGWLHAMVGRQEKLEEDIRELAAQVEMLTAEMTRILTALGVDADWSKTNSAQ
jgi:uncharacterized protein (UPF0335 family)